MKQSPLERNIYDLLCLFLKAQGKLNRRDCRVFKHIINNFLKVCLNARNDKNICQLIQK